MSAWLPACFESAIEAMVTYSIATVDNESATLTFVVTAGRIETYPTTWSMFTLSGQVL
jgi:hypothetical protein